MMRFESLRCLPVFARDTLIHGRDERRQALVPVLPRMSSGVLVIFVIDGTLAQLRGKRATRRQKRSIVSAAVDVQPRNCVGRNSLDDPIYVFRLTCFGACRSESLETA